LLQDGGAMGLGVRAAEVVLAAQRLDGLDGGHHLLVAHVEHGPVDAQTGAHRHEGAIQERTVRQTEADVAEAAGGADGQAILDQLEGLHGDLRSRGIGRDRQDERVDPHVFGRQADAGAQVVQLLGHGEPVLGGRRDALFAEAERDDRALVLLDERQGSVDARLLTADRVDERDLAALVDDQLHAVLEHGGAGRVDHELHVGDAHHGLDEPSHVGDLVAAGDSAVHVQHSGPGLDLVGSKGLDELDVTRLDRLGDLLARPIDRFTHQQH
jgi:hypothetical protein